MNRITKHSIARLGYDFVDPEFLPPGKDEYYLRDKQKRQDYEFRELAANEIEVLIKNENTADDWAAIFVTDRFNPKLVKGCQFFGVVRIGALENYYLEFHDLRLPVGLYDSTIVSWTTNYAKFGNGVVKDGESKSVRIWLDIGNENGGRRVAPFDGMLPADAYLWSKYRDDKQLMARLLAMVDARCDPHRGYYGEVGDRTIIKDCRILKDVRIGSDAYIKGANKLKNVTVNSDAEEGSQIGEGVELVNGIIGYGCRVFYGVKAVRFIMGPNSSLKYGARLVNSFLGDNSTISCCEVLNSLIFPGHEQHHNNSFLCAATVLGQSNMAAGVTAGSNHNSRANDGEIVAGRGFWPGLCTSLKHNSRFASFTLLAKGAYPAQLDISLPFALISNDEANGELLIMPAYWFMHNMYALARNAWKYGARDKRIHKNQMIEFEALAPDTVEEIFTALDLLELWAAKAAARRANESIAGLSEADLRARGRELLEGSPEVTDKLEILGENIENSSRPVRILKAARAYASYREMVHYYAIKTLVAFMLEQKLVDLHALQQRLGQPRRGHWINMGGQLLLADDFEGLRNRIISDKLDSWDALHAAYVRLWEKYPEDRARHALQTLLDVNRISLGELDRETWLALLDRAAATGDTIAERTRASRAKDYTDSFRQITYASRAEMDAVVGLIDDNDFIQQTYTETEAFHRDVTTIRHGEGV